MKRHYPVTLFVTVSFDGANYDVSELSFAKHDVPPPDPKAPDVVVFRIPPYLIEDKSAVFYVSVITVFENNGEKSFGYAFYPSSREATIWNRDRKAKPKPSQSVLLVKEPDGFKILIEPTGLIEEALQSGVL